MTIALHKVTAQEVYEGLRQHQRECGLQEGDVEVPAAWHLLSFRQQSVFEGMAERINASHAPYKARESTHYVKGKRNER